MNHSHCKSLGFYSIAIVSVFLLFQTISAYGETNLKAPLVVKSQYNLMLTDLPKCKKSQELILKIQQSGIYLTAYLLPKKSNGKSQKKYQTNYLFSGILKNKKMILSGEIDKNILCNIASFQKPKLNSAKLQMQLVKPGNFIGQLTVNNNPVTLKVTAIPHKISSNHQ
jgi:hypothetical protein